MSGESINKSQEGYARATGWEDLAEFSGERNINDATGKERTFSEFDIYPRMQGESSEEYGARLRKMHEMTDAYLEEQSNKEAKENAILNEDNIRTENYENSEFGQKELSAEAEYDALEAKLNQEVAEGKIKSEEANKMLEEKMEAAYGVIEDARQDYTDRQTVGTEEVAVEEEPAVETEPEPVIELSEETQKRRMDDYLNIDDMLRSGRIDEEKAAHFREEVEEKYRNEALAAKATEEAAEEVAEPEAEPEPAAETSKEAIARQKEMLENVIIPTESVEEVKKEAGMTPEEKRREDMMDYFHLVESNFSQINGQLGEDILLDDGFKDISDIQRDMWWDSLDNEARKVVTGIYLQREEISNRWLEGSEKHLFPRGQKFANWIAKKIVRFDRAA